MEKGTKLVCIRGVSGLKQDMIYTFLSIEASVCNKQYTNVYPECQTCAGDCYRTSRKNKNFPSYGQCRFIEI
jgi:hypothetical protein